MAESFKFTFKAPATGGSWKAAPGKARTAATDATPSLQAFDLFPTRIWQAQLTHLAPRLDAWSQAVDALRAAHPETAGRTNRKGWNSEDMAVLGQPGFEALEQAVHAACRSALEQMGVGELPFDLQSWVNMHDRGGFNFLHVHEGSLLSGTFYLRVPEGSGRLVFRDPRPGVIHGYLKGAVPNGYRDIQLTPSAGLLVLFPCWMEHFVEPHGSDIPRISISFNAIPA